MHVKSPLISAAPEKTIQSSSSSSIIIII